MGLQDAAFPSSAAFDQIASAISSEADRKDAVKKTGAIFAFTLKNKDGEQKSWYLDLKKSGTVGQGLAPEGEKPTGEWDEYIGCRVYWAKGRS
jgi:hypothetical protein